MITRPLGGARTRQARTAQIALNEPFNANSFSMVSGLFPLWLRAPRFVCAACSSHSALLSGARGGSCLVGGRNPPPAPPHPRSFGFRRRTTPLLVFISVCCGVASASSPLDFVEGRRSSLAMDAHSGNSPEAECKCSPKSV